MQIEIWTLPDCPRCTEIKTALEKIGLNFTERSMVELRRGEILDADALAELVLRDGEAPMVRVDGRFLNDAEVEKLRQGEF